MKRAIPIIVALVAAALVYVFVIRDRGGEKEKPGETAEVDTTPTEVKPPTTRSSAGNNRGQ